MGRLKAGEAGPEGGGAAGGLREAGPSWVTSWVTVEVSRTLATLCTLLAVTQLPGAVEGEVRHLATPLETVRSGPLLPGTPSSPDVAFAEGKPPGYHIPNLPYLRSHLEGAFHTPFPHLWDNQSYHHRHRFPLQPHHHHHNHNHSLHKPHHHSWEIESGTVEEDEEDEEEEGRIENGKNVNGEGISSRLSISSSHHHHKHHRQKQMLQPTMKRRSSISPARSEAGGYAFRVDEKSGVRRVIAVREAAGLGDGGASADGDAGSMNRLLDIPQDDATVGPPPGPSFDRNLPRNITIQTGKTAVLSCRVFNVNDKSVSWIRQDNLHILTVDKYKYSTDQRVSVLFNEPNLEWVLRIKSVTPADAGTYECQVSTKPILSFVVNMRVVDELSTPTSTPAPTPVPIPEMIEDEETTETARNTSEVPRAWILNAPEIYVHRGSPINLTCVVTHGTERPVFIYWYHHDQVIDYEGRGGVRVHTQTGRDTVSHLLVKEAGPGDTGRYTCSPSNGEPASVMLHVLNGEHQAAMQTNGSTSLGEPGGVLEVLLILLALLHALPRPYVLRL